MGKEDLITVIVPVYNVEPYLPTCLQSIIHQSYQHIEILVVLANSTDSSEAICNEWAQKDNRIQIIKQTHGRLGTARNIGIEKAHGKYISFLDADDWWDLNILDELYHVIKLENADMVMCDRYNVYFDAEGNETKKDRLTEAAMYGMANSVNMNRNLIRAIEVSVNGKLYKKRLFDEYNLLQPDCFGEDRAIMHYLIACCKKIGRVRKALYYYRVGRENNSVNSAQTYLTVVDCMEYIHRLFCEKGWCHQYRNQLQYIYYTIAELGKYAFQNYEHSGLDVKTVIKSIDSFLDRHCYNPFSVKYILGSYSLRHSLWMLWPIKIGRIHYSYSSIISMFSDPVEGVHLCNRNILNTDREKWINADIRKDFKTEFRPGKNDVLFLDFLEEREDVLRIGNSYITYGELTKACIDLKDDYEIISRTSDTCTRLFFQKCLQFISFLKERIDAKRVILVKFKLTELYGVDSSEVVFSSIKKIRIVNAILERYYDYFAKHFPGIKVVECSDKYFYTLKNFRYGCVPWHMNDLFYMEESEEINKCLEGIKK